jgi:hypothetical protein
MVMGAMLTLSFASSSGGYGGAGVWWILVAVRLVSCTWLLGQPGSKARSKTVLSLVQPTMPCA